MKRSVSRGELILALDSAVLIATAFLVGQGEGEQDLITDEIERLRRLVNKAKEEEFTIAAEAVPEAAE